MIPSNSDTHSHTSMETYKMLPEGTLAEPIDNMVYDLPSPVHGHQSASKIILRKLLEGVEDLGLGQVFHAPFDVYLDEIANAVQPDLIVVLNDNLKIIDRRGHIHGVPDLLIEILSKSNKKSRSRQKEGTLRTVWCKGILDHRSGNQKDNWI
jgi:Uma2 family endonuclease